MDIINNTDMVKWSARIFLIVCILGFFWWVYNKKDTYNYEGITKYQKEHPLLNQFIQQLVGAKKPPQTHKKRVNKTEDLCRNIVQKIYGKKFPSVRPDFLRSPVTKKNLELDCYNEELRIALEYNGQQHYTYTPHFHRNKQNFYSQVHRDDWKRKRCRELGIRLIEIPYWVSPIDLEEYIIKELKKKGCL